MIPDSVALLIIVIAVIYLAVKTPQLKKKVPEVAAPGETKIQKGQNV